MNTATTVSKAVQRHQSYPGFFFPYYGECADAYYNLKLEDGTIVEKSKYDNTQGCWVSDSGVIMDDDISEVALWVTDVQGISVGAIAVPAVNKFDKAGWIQKLVEEITEESTVFVVNEQGGISESERKEILDGAEQLAESLSTRELIPLWYSHRHIPIETFYPHYWDDMANSIKEVIRAELNERYAAPKAPEDLPFWYPHRHIPMSVFYS